MTEMTSTPAFALWAFATLLGALIMAYTTRRIYKVGEKGSVIKMPMMFPVMLFMVINEFIMPLWMISIVFGLTTLATFSGWVAAVLAFVHAFSCWQQAAKADDFEPG